MNQVQRRGYSTDSENNPLLQATSHNPVDERIGSTEGHSTKFESETTSESLVIETSKSMITEGFPTSTIRNPMDEATKGPVEQEIHTSEAGKKRVPWIFLPIYAF